MGIADTTCETSSSAQNKNDWNSTAKELVTSLTASVEVATIKLLYKSN
jgi:hypothetical protein